MILVYKEALSLSLEFEHTSLNGVIDCVYLECSLYEYITKGGPPIVQLGIQQAKEKLMRLVESNPELS